MIATTTPHLPLVHTDRTWITECAKCSGTGSVSWGVNLNGVVADRTAPQGQRVVPKVCFDCNGVGFGTDTLRLETRRAKDRARRDAKAAAKAAAEWAAGQAQRDADAAALAEWTTAHADVIDALPAVAGEFGENLRAALRETGRISDRAVELVRADIAARATATPVPAGRGVVTGELLSTKLVENGYGTTVKMLVRDDRGFKVWGSMPSSLYAAKGERVTFTATLEASQDDETFGFFSRPTKAKNLTEEVIAEAA